MVSSVTYNAADQPLVITLGLGDTDTYTYDPNTGRMLSYAFAIGSPAKTSTGTYNWNANGTLRGLLVVDGINSANSESCAYGNSSTAGYDALGRLISAVCTNTGGTNVWGQIFSYDAFNNITKSVPTGDTGIAWVPVYNSSNQFNTATYDANGNVLTDPFHTYTWNQDNKIKTLDSATVVHDAFGATVETHGTNVTSGYMQQLISPVGVVGAMSGQNLLADVIHIPGGGIVTSDNSFWHMDALGSEPLTSSRATRVFGNDQAFAPYGEVYNQIGTGGDNDEVTGDFQWLANGTYDTPNRELNPNAGRWLSPDPAHSSWNAYAYSTNPLGTRDSSGLGPINPVGTNCFPWCLANPLTDPQAGLANFINSTIPWSNTSGSNQQVTATVTATSFDPQNSENNPGGVTPEESCASDPNGGCLRSQTSSGKFGGYFWNAGGTNLVYPGLRPGDVPADPKANVVFQGNAATWQNSSGAGNTALVATGGVALLPLAASVTPYVTAIAPAVTTLSITIWYSPTSWQIASDFIQGVTPGGPVPASYAAAAGEVVGYYDNTTP
jgi:RHS repeat-associated protein